MPGTTIWAQANPTDVVGYAFALENNGSYFLYFTVAANGTLDAIWFFSPPGVSATSLPSAVAIYSTSGTQLAANSSPSWSGAAGSGWVRTTVPSVSVASGSGYYAEYYFGSGNTGNNQGYLFDNGGSGSDWFPTTSSDGKITAPLNDSSGNPQGGYANGSGGLVSAPASHLGAGSGINWLLDVEITFTATAPKSLLMAAYI